MKEEQDFVDRLVMQSLSSYTVQGDGSDWDKLSVRLRKKTGFRKYLVYIGLAFIVLFSGWAYFIFQPKSQITITALQNTQSRVDLINIASVHGEFNQNINTPVNKSSIIITNDSTDKIVVNKESSFVPPKTTSFINTFSTTLNATNTLQYQLYKNKTLDTLLVKETAMNSPEVVNNDKNENVEVLKSNVYQGCVPYHIQLSAGVLNAKDWYWNIDDKAFSSLEYPDFTFNQKGVYTVKMVATLADGYQYHRIDTIKIVEKPALNYKISAQIISLPTQILICNNFSPKTTYCKWYFGNGDAIQDDEAKYKFKTEGEYTISLAVRDQNNCYDSIVVLENLVVNWIGYLQFPNAFKPAKAGSKGGYYVSGFRNADNTIFHPVSKGISEYKMVIFDRSGLMIFETSDINIGWDGYYKDRLCKQDTYIFKVSGKYINGESFFEAGDVTLVY